MLSWSEIHLAVWSPLCYLRPLLENHLRNWVKWYRCNISVNVSVWHISIVFFVPIFLWGSFHHASWTLYPLSDSPDPAAILQLTFQNYFRASREKKTACWFVPWHYRTVQNALCPFLQVKCPKVGGKVINPCTVWDKLGSKRTRLQLGHHCVKGYRCRVNGVKINYMPGSPNWYLPQHEDNTQSIIFVLSSS